MVALVHEDLFFPHGAVMFHTGIFFTTIAGIAVVLRVLGNNIRKNGIRLDDGFIVAGYVFWLIEQCLGLHGLREGREARSLTDSHFTTFRRLTYIGSAFYFPATTCVRVGIVLFYRSIFATPVTPNFTRISSIILVVLVLFGISTTLAEAMACIPAEAEWNPTVSGRCLKFTPFFITTAATECFFDVVIITLPLVEVFRLQMSWGRRIMVALIFLLGSFSVVTGILRVALSAGSRKNGQIDIEADILWMQVHNGTLFLCACLPTYRPLVRTALEWLNTVWSSLTGTKFGTSQPDGRTNLPSQEDVHVWNDGNIEAGNVVMVNLNEKSEKRRF